MPDGRAPFRAVVVRFAAAGPGAATPDVLRLAAQIARLLGADLQGVFVEDEQLLMVADVPLSREVDRLRALWRPFDRAQLAQDTSLVAAAMRRRLSAAASAAGVAVEFSIVRSDTDTAFTAFHARRDVIIVAAPGNHRPHVQTLGAGLLYAPPRLARRTGVIVVLAPDVDCAQVRVAEQVADAAHERLLVLDAAGSAAQLHESLGDMRERLIVAAPGVLADSDTAQQLATLRRIPVLVVPG